MQIRNLHRMGWAANCYLVTEGCDAVVIDPSAPADAIVDLLSQSDLQLQAILLTHGHFDHMLALDALRDVTGAPAYLHRGDADFPGDPTKSCYLSMLGRDIRHRPAEHLLEGGELLNFGALHFTVLHTPGHTGGCVCYRADDALFTGDTLFAEGYGRTDLPGGSLTALRQSLERLTAMRDEPLTIYPGHGEPSGLADAIAWL